MLVVLFILCLQLLGYRNMCTQRNKPPETFLQRWKNIWMCKQCLYKKSYLWKKLCKIVCCFVEKVSNVATFQLLVAFLAHFEYFCYFLAFFHYWGLLGLLRCFVANYICRNLLTVSGNFFWIKPWSCNKVVFFNLCLPSHCIEWWFPPLNQPPSPKDTPLPQKTLAMQCP